MIFSYPYCHKTSMNQYGTKILVVLYLCHGKLHVPRLTISPQLTIDINNHCNRKIKKKSAMAKNIIDCNKISIVPTIIIICDKSISTQFLGWLSSWWVHTINRVDVWYIGN